MEYKEFKIDYETPFGRLEQFYDQMGIFGLITEIKKEYNIPQEALVSYQLVKCNQKTHDKLRDQLYNNWKYYNYDRYTGQVPKGRKLRKYKREHPLSYGDQSRLTWHYELGCSPMVDETVPNDVIRVITEWNEEIINDIKKRYIQDTKFKEI